jgi:integrase
MAKAPLKLADDRRRKPSRKVHLSKRLIESWRPSADHKRKVVHDDSVPGLCVVVNATTVSFYVYRRVIGHPMRLRLGGFPAMTVEQARKLAQKHSGEIAEGKDPREMRRAIRGSDPLGTLWQRWRDEYAKTRHTERTRLTDENRYATCLERWKNRNIGSIREADVRALHADLAKERGNVTANRAVQLLRRLLNFARLQPNPAGGRAVSFFPERSRERFLLPEELPCFFKALDEEPDETLRDFFYASLWTGQRRGNVSSMRWDELHLKEATWVIPGTKTKNHEPHRVHLATPMLELLVRRKNGAEQAIARGDDRYAHGYVFPAYRHAAKTPHLTEVKSAWNRLLTRAGLKDLRIHDLRRSLGSWAAMTGASTLVIGKALGHLDQSSTAIYARLNLDPVRVAVDAATAAMQRVVSAANKPKKKKA